MFVKKELLLLVLLGLVILVNCKPGKPWTKKNMIIIRNQLKRLWQFPEAYIVPFDKWYEGGKGKGRSTRAKYYNDEDDFEDLEEGFKGFKDRYKHWNMHTMLHLPKEVQEFQWRDDKFLHDEKLAKEYLYDPDGKLAKADCDKRNEANCGGWFDDDWRRSEDYAFTERKMLRLTFHDCVPYEDGTGGCDGCLNFDANHDDNIGLQHSVAVLERMYTDKNFPLMLEHEATLKDSMKNLGYSRADFWAFAGLIALDEVQRKTKGICTFWDWTYTCKENGCYTQLPDDFLKLFKSGRSDCQPKDPNDLKHLYLTDKVEAHPDKNQNGPKTKEYFEDRFNITGKEGLALLGIHTVGRFNPQFTHWNYAWKNGMSEHRTALFNNEYFKTLSLQPTKIKDGLCIGNTMTGEERAKAVFHPFANIFEYTWDPLDPWSTKTRLGEVSWRMQYVRGPVCGKAERFINEDETKFWKDAEKYGGKVLKLSKIAEDANKIINDKDLDDEKKVKVYNAVTGKFKKDLTGWDICCWVKDQKENETPDIVEEKLSKTLEEMQDLCTLDVKDRKRFLNSEVGYYLDFSFTDKGTPQGCDAFTKRKDDRFKVPSQAVFKTTKVKDAGKCKCTETRCKKAIFEPSGIGKKGKGDCKEVGDFFDQFENEEKEKWKSIFENNEWFLKEESVNGFHDAKELGPHGCTINQTMKDGFGNEGQPMNQTVLDFAANQTLWQEVMVGALAKVQYNGYDASNDLKGYKSTSGYITERCCIQSYVSFSNGIYQKETIEGKDPKWKDCKKKCSINEEFCTSFAFNPDVEKENCILLISEPSEVITSRNVKNADLCKCEDQQCTMAIFDRFAKKGSKNCKEIGDLEQKFEAIKISQIEKDSTLECQLECGTNEKCNFFTHNEIKRKCRLFSETPEFKMVDKSFHTFGSPKCEEGMDYCKAYGKLV